MSQFWDSIAARTAGQHTAEEFEAAAYRLVVEQVIYYADRHSRTAYWMIERYERDFKQALAPLGVTVEVNRQLRYAFAQPRHEKAGTASVAQTMLALVLRAVYDEAARIGQLTDDGEVVCDLVELEEKYRLMTGRELPAKGELDSLMKSMKRWGIAKKSDEQGADGGEGPAATQPYVVVIRPAIVDLLGEAALQRLAQWHVAAPSASKADEDGSGSGDTSDGETEAA
jgi:hypothetical protein